MKLAAVITVAGCLPAFAQNTGISFRNGGVDTHVDVPYSTGLVPTDGITVEAWLTYDPTSVPTGGFRWPTVVRQGVQSAGPSYYLRIADFKSGYRNLEWGVHNGTRLALAVYGFSATRFTTWTHIACTYDADTATMTIYENGQPVVTAYQTGPVRDTQGKLRIGNGVGAVPGHEVWNGEIDELRVWPVARTAAEIRSTMRDELSGIPHGVSFNFNNALFDSSGGRTGVPTGQVPYVPSLPLASNVIGGFAYGPTSTNCRQNLRTTLGSKSTLGNSAFAAWCYGAPHNAPGAMLMSTGSAVPNPSMWFGIQLNLHLATLLPFGAATATGNFGSARMPLPIPSAPSLSGSTLWAQFVFSDATCGSQGFALVGSEGVSLTVQ